MRDVKAPFVLAGLLLVGCAAGGEATATAGPPPTFGPPAHAAWAQAEVDASTAWLRSHPAGKLRKGHILAVAVATGSDGPPDHVRWRAALVTADGRVRVMQSALGESGDLALLIQPGDVVDVWADYGMIQTEDGDAMVVAKQAVRVGA